MKTASQILLQFHMVMYLSRFHDSNVGESISRTRGGSAQICVPVVLSLLLLVCHEFEAIDGR